MKLFYLGAAALAVLAAAPVAAQRDVVPPPRIRVPLVADAPRVDGSLDDPGWSAAARLEDWVQTRPGDNVDPIGRTTALLAHDGTALYVAVRAQAGAGTVRHALHARDVVSQQGQDWIGMELDPFNDRRRAYGFAVNPIGVQGDGMRTEGGGFGEWDGIFETAGRVDADLGGFSVEIRIPFKSLRFREGDTQVWGFGISRMYGGEGAQDRPWPLDRDRGCDLCQMAELILDGVQSARNLEVNPTLVTRGEADRREDGALSAYDNMAEAGLNLKLGLTPSLTLDGTLNPDFSQIESDAGQLEVNNRFALFYPEKRPFFLEAAEVFGTGIPLPGRGQFSRPPISLVHSRTIVDPDWGAKLTGKAGPVALGVIAAADAASPLDRPEQRLVPGEGATDVVARARVDVLEDGFIGGIFTLRQHAGETDVLGGMDARLRVGENLILRGIGAGTRGWMYWDSAGESRWSRRDGAIVQLQADWLSRHWAGGLAVVDITGDAIAPLGFVPRTDQILYTGAWSWIWRGSGAVQRAQPQLRWERIHLHTNDSRFFDAGRKVDELIEPSLSLELARATSVRLGYERAYTWYDGTDFPGLDRLNFRVTSEALGWLGLEATIGAGEEVIFRDRVKQGAAKRGWGIQGSVTGTLRPAPPVRLAGSLTAARLWRVGTDGARGEAYADALIPRLKAEIQATRRLGVRAIGEWRAERFLDHGNRVIDDRRLAVELLASYVIDSASALHLGWTELRDAEIGLPLAPERRGGVAKVSYLWRF